MPKPTPLRRIFIIGCPRSGTTVVQSLLASLPNVMSMGETNYLLCMLGNFNAWLNNPAAVESKWRKRLALARASSRRDLQDCLDQAFGGSNLAPRLRRRMTGRGYIDELRRVLDAEAIRRNCTCWVEKTPDHLAYLSILEKQVPDAHFLHMVRSGPDVIASAIEGQIRFSEHEVFLGSIPYWVKRWNRATQVHLQYAGRPRHTVLPYACLFTATAQVQELLRDLSGASATALGSASGQLDHIVDLADEPWKKGSIDETLRPPQRKFEGLFGPCMRQWLNDHLTGYAEVIATLAERQPTMPWVASAAEGVPVDSPKIRASLGTHKA
jgi:hypothetical protein